MKSISVKEICEMTGGVLLCDDSASREQAECLSINSVITNSKEGNEHAVFVPLIGERHDAHDFIADAYNHGARVTFSSRRERMPGTEEMVYILVEDTLTALQKLGQKFRENYDGIIIGITGSVGKTTTKEMVAMALQSEAEVLKTYGNRNSQVGVPGMMLELEDKYRFAVIEMGMSLPGEMSRLSKIVAPRAAVITNIGMAHIGQLGSQENIRTEKLCICNDFPANGGKLFVNGDDPMLREVEKVLPADKKIEIIRFGLSPESDYYADNISVAAGCTDFVFRNDAKAVAEPVFLPAVGTHNVTDAVAALAVANEFNIAPCAAKKTLEHYQPLSMRGTIENVKGVILIDDTYNASPDSVKSGLDVLESMKTAGKKIAVLGSILELGEHSGECHYGVGVYAGRKKIDALLTYGEEAVKIAGGARAAAEEQGITCAGTFSEEGMFIKEYLDREKICEEVVGNLREGDIVYLKGSRGMRLDLLAQKIRER